MFQLAALLLLLARTAVSLECGAVYDNTGHRIVGGFDGGSLMYPWFANLRRNVAGNPPGCGGVLITKKHVLTAAHCFPDGNKEDAFNVALNTYDRCDESEASRRVYSVSKAVTHEDYDPNTHFNDIALVTMNETTDLSFACLPPRSAQNKSEPGVIMGFGYTEEGGASGEPCHLHQANITKLSPEECQDTFLPEEYKESTITFCGGGVSGVDSCQGDSGGPFMTFGADGSYTASGIVSSGFGCAREGFPGLYTNVAAYLDWIMDRIDGESTETAPKNSGGARVSWKNPGSNEAHSSRADVTFPESRNLLRAVRKLDYSDGEPNSDFEEVINAGNISDKGI